MKNQQIESQVLDQNLPVLANAVALVAGSINQIAGNDMSNALDGERVTPDAMEQLVAAKLQAKLAPMVGE